MTLVMAVMVRGHGGNKKAPPKRGQVMERPDYGRRVPQAVTGNIARIRASRWCQ